MEQQEAILLEWFGEQSMDGALLERVRRKVGAAFAVPTGLSAVNGPPADTLDARRRQRSSTKILRWMLERAPSGAGKRLGITDADLFIPALTFVFGEAQVGGRVGVVSMARLHFTYDGQSLDPPAVEARLVKECLHELGHTFGLVHCPDPACVMSRSNSLLDVDQKQPEFCRDCRLRLQDLQKKRDAS